MWYATDKIQELKQYIKNRETKIEELKKDDDMNSYLWEELHTISLEMWEALE